MLVHKEFGGGGGGGGAKEKGDGLTPVPEDVDEGREDGEEEPKVGGGGGRSVRKKHDIASKTESSSNLRGKFLVLLIICYVHSHPCIDSFLAMILLDSCLGYKILHGFIARFLNDHAKELFKILLHFSHVTIT